MKRRWLRSVTGSLGATTICCLWIVGPLISPSHEAVYHWSGPAGTFFIPAILDFVCGWFVFAILLFVAQGSTAASVVVWAGVTLLLPWFALKSGALLLDWIPPHWATRALSGFCVLSFLLFCVCWRSEYLATLERARQITIDVLSVVAMYGLIVLVQLTWVGFHARRLNVLRPLHKTVKSSPQATVRRPRIVWILLDELSYRQVYEHRFPTLKLPAFDRLAKQATVFTSVVPAGNITGTVMPALIAGLLIDQIQLSSSGVELRIHNAVSKQWQVFDPHDTIFSDALAAGYRTAVAGWYIPYCRILPEVLDRCFWTFDQLAANRMLSRASIIDNMVNPLLQSPTIWDHLPSTVNQGTNTEDEMTQMHIWDYQQISHSADQLLQEPGIDFILIHMAIPHPGGIYDRATQTFATRKSTYIDNLALADVYLAHVRSLLEAEGQWDFSAIVIMGDHSWRTELIWKAEPNWTAEEQEASDGGQFDERPAYIVKLPDQQDGTTIKTPFPAVDTRMLLEAVMNRQVISPKDLSAWAGTLEEKR